MNVVTITEKILANNSGRDRVIPGEIIEVTVDKAMIHDNNAALVIKNFEKIYSPEVWDPDKVVFFIDHHTPSTTVRASKHHDTMRKFAKKHSIKNFYDCGCGISHVVMIEDGHAQRGKVIVGTDSHTTGEGAMGSFATGIGATEMAAVLVKGKIWLKVPHTIRINAEGKLPAGTTTRDLINLILNKIGPDGASYCAIEFGGKVFRNLDIDGRIMSCVMSMEMGAKNAFIDDEKESENTPEYYSFLNINVENLEPLVAVPDLPTNAVPVTELSKQKIKIDQAAIASCAGALLSDLKEASDIMKGKFVAKGTRLLVIPASRRIYSEALKLGYIKTLHDSGAIITSPGCGACGAHDSGIITDGEVCISSSTRNMNGRMGPGGKVYLGSSSVVAAAAIAGHITDPREFLHERWGC